MSRLSYLNNISIIMKTTYLLISFLVPASLLTITAQTSEITTVVIVRHAEKDTLSNNPPLTDAGEMRAIKLAEMLSESEISAVFSTNTTRTIETVNNYADERGLEIILYDDLFDLTENIKSNYRGEKVLVSAHSNTIGPLMFALGTDSILQIDHDYYSGFFIVTITSRGEVSWLHLEY